MCYEELEFLRDFVGELERQVKRVEFETWTPDAEIIKPVNPTIKCVVCGFDKLEYDMTKVFKQWTNGKVSQEKGICKRCWNYDGEDF